jgi:hypothetical protein
VSSSDLKVYKELYEYQLALNKALAEGIVEKILTDAKFQGLKDLKDQDMIDVTLHGDIPDYLFRDLLDMFSKMRDRLEFNGVIYIHGEKQSIKFFRYKPLDASKPTSKPTPEKAVFDKPSTPSEVEHMKLGELKDAYLELAEQFLEIQSIYRGLCK